MKEETEIFIHITTNKISKQEEIGRKIALYKSSSYSNVALNSTFDGQAFDWFEQSRDLRICTLLADD